MTIEPIQEMVKWVICGTRAALYPGNSRGEALEHLGLFVLGLKIPAYGPYIHLSPLIALKNSLKTQTGHGFKEKSGYDPNMASH